VVFGGVFMHDASDAWREWRTSQGMINCFIQSCDDATLVSCSTLLQRSIVEAMSDYYYLQSETESNS
jgi:hypothetical protein